MTKATLSRRLSEREIQVWRGFLRAHATLTRLLEAELLAAHQLSLPEYGVLVTLVEAPQHRLRMTELAEQVLISRSGLTRLVDRMQGAGLVERFRCPSDARGMHAVLTDVGYQRLKEASGTHLRGVRRHATGQLSDAELDQMQTLMTKITVSD